jgi:hypothetical protein
MKVMEQIYKNDYISIIQKTFVLLNPKSNCHPEDIPIAIGRRANSIIKNGKSINKNNQYQKRFSSWKRNRLCPEGH